MTLDVWRPKPLINGRQVICVDDFGAARTFTRMGILTPTRDHVDVTCDDRSLVDARQRLDLHFAILVCCYTNRYILTP